MSYSIRRSAQRFRVQLLALAALTVLVSAPLAVRAAEEEAGPGTAAIACTDKAWKDYHDCLWDGRNSEFRMKVCDLAFVVDMAFCGVKVFGDFRDVVL